MQAGFGLYSFRKRASIRSVPLQSRWKSQRWCYSFPCCWIWKEQAEKYLAPIRCKHMVNGLAQSLESFSFWQELLMSNYILPLLRRKITLKSEIKSDLSQPVWKKDAWNYGRPAWNFPSVHRCRSQLNRPFGFRRLDCYAARNNATEQELLRDTCCSHRKFVH